MNNIVQHFNFIDSAGRGYKFAFDQRPILWQLALVPVSLKILSYILIVSMGFEQHYLRQGLLFLPSYLAEGWFIALAVRMAALGDYGQNLLTGNVQKDLAFHKNRARCVQGAMVLYALLKLIIAMVSGLMMSLVQSEDLTQIDQAEAPMSEYMFGLSLGFIALSIWLFRFLWLYVPLAVDMRVRYYVRLTNSFSLSLMMLGLWILCFVPFLLLLGVGDGMLRGAFGEGMVYKMSLATLQSVFEVIIALISSVGMAYGIKDLMKAHAKNKGDQT